MRFINILTIGVLCVGFASLLIAIQGKEWMKGTLPLVTDRSKNVEINGGVFKFYVKGIAFSYSETEKLIRGQNAEELSIGGIKAKVDGAAAFMVFSIMTSLSGLVVVCAGIKLENARLMNIGAHVVTLAGSFAIIAISFYGGAMGFVTLNKTMSYGYAYVFAWIGVVSHIMGGITAGISSHSAQIGRRRHSSRSENA